MLSAYPSYFFERDDRYVIGISPNYEIQQDNTDPITHVQWNETDRDTIRCHIKRNKDGSLIVCTKIWYNDSLGVVIKKDSRIFGRNYKLRKLEVKKRQAS